MRERLERIVELTEDQSYSHAARMVEIKKIVLALLIQLVAEEKAAAAYEKKPSAGAPGGTPSAPDASSAGTPRPATQAAPAPRPPA